jgi:hypothetical protein
MDTTASLQNTGLELETKAAGGLRQFHYNTNLHQISNLLHSSNCNHTPGKQLCIANIDSQTSCK